MNYVTYLPWITYSEIKRNKQLIYTTIQKKSPENYTELKKKNLTQKHGILYNSILIIFLKP